MRLFFQNAKVCCVHLLKILQRVFGGGWKKALRYCRERTPVKFCPFSVYRYPIALLLQIPNV